MPYEPDFNIDYRCVSDIFDCRTIGEIKAAAESFVAVSGTVEDMNVWILCQRFSNIFAEWSKPYYKDITGSALNAVIIPPEHAPIMLLPSCVPFGKSPNEIIAGLKNFIIRCDEFTPQIYNSITVAEIKKVLSAAQKAYGLIDIIAPKEPIKILLFANSHNAHNSQCGIPDDPTRTPQIYLFHPKENDTYDRVFICAHELGHALHLSLTRDVDILPDGFDKFNELYFKRIENLKEKQEAFADAVALAILNVKGLGTHFPTQFSKNISPVFARYIKELTQQF